jgi:hypothetical protein
MSRRDHESFSHCKTGMCIYCIGIAFDDGPPPFPSPSEVGGDNSKGRVVNRSESMCVCVCVCVMELSALPVPGLFELLLDVVVVVG